MDIGDRLKEAREALGLTLEAVEEETKIRRKYIKAMEEEQFHILPGPIYAKAFLKNYAKFLKLDAGEILEIYNQKFALEENQETSKRSPEKQVEVGASGRSRYRLYFAIAVVILGLVVFVYYGVTRMVSSRDINEGDSGQIPLPSSEQVQVPGDQQKPARQEPPAETTGVHLVLNVKDAESWVGVEADGSPVFQGLLSAGQSKSFEAKEKIFITLGNAGAVEVVYNGKNLGFLGGSGDVVKREFTAQPQD